MTRTISMLFVLASMTAGLAAAADEAPPAPAAETKTKVAPTSKAPTSRRRVPPPKAPTAKAKGTPSTPAASASKAAPVKLAPPAELPVTQIVERNVAARGGLEAWRRVSSLTMSGELDAGGKKDTRLPFVMSLKRPQRSRLEIKLKDQSAVQVWDGAHGWKVRPFLNRNEVEPYTAAEARSAAAAAELDGPLVDFARKGTKVELAGTEVVEGRNTYKLRLTLKSGERRHLWIDATSFLEVKIDGEPRRMDGRVRSVAVFYRDFKKVGGLQIPHTMETVVEKVSGSHKLSVLAVKVNPPLDDGLFAKPRLGSGGLASR